MDNSDFFGDNISSIEDIMWPPLLKMDPAGLIYLNVDSPLNIADPYTKILVWGDPSDLHKNCASKLVSLSHYKACTQLYNTLPDQVKSEFRIYQPIADDDALIPSRLGEVDSGDIVVSHPYVLFRRWLMAGLTRDPNLTERSPLYPTNCIEAYKCVWSDMESKALIDELNLDFINARREPFTISIDPITEILVTISMPTKDNSSTWCKSIPEQAPFYDELVTVGRLYALTPEEWIHRNYDGNAVVVALEHIGCKLNFLAVSTLLHDFKKARSAYNSGDEIKAYLHDYFKMIKHIPRKQGSHAQFVSSTTDGADWKIQVSDQEAYLGFMFDPCERVDFDPHFKTYGRKRRSESRFEYAKTDLKIVNNQSYQSI